MIDDPTVQKSDMYPNKVRSASEARRLGLIPKADQPPFFQRFMTEKLDVEQIILNSINAIQMTALAMTDWDATKFNAMFTAGVLNLDTFVHGVLCDLDTTNVQEYLAERDDLIEEWENTEDGEKRASVVRHLYDLIVRALNREGAFRLRRTSYFGMGWKKKQDEKILATLEDTVKREQDDQSVE